MAGKIERKYMAHFVDTANLCATTATTASWYRLGDDFEEFNIELNPDTEVVKNIKGQTRFDHNGYEPSSSGDPYYAREGDDLFPKLQAIVDNRYQGDQCKTNTLEVHLWEAGTTTGSFVAYQQPAYIVPTQYGGDTSGYQIPFDVNYVGARVKGDFKPTEGQTKDNAEGGEFIPVSGGALG